MYNSSSHYEKKKIEYVDINLCYYLIVYLDVLLGPSMTLATKLLMP